MCCLDAGWYIHRCDAQRGYAQYDGFVCHHIRDRAAYLDAGNRKSRSVGRAADFLRRARHHARRALPITEARRRLKPIAALAANRVFDLRMPIFFKQFVQATYDIARKRKAAIDQRRIELYRRRAGANLGVSLL